MTNHQELRMLLNIIPEMTDRQIVALVNEELNELGRALSKFQRYGQADPTLRKDYISIRENIKEEYCDVMICLFYLKKSFGFPDKDIEKIIDEKLTRTEDMLRGKDA